MMRGGHLYICVLGAFQVSVAGDLANWHTGEPDAIPAVGGTMNLAIGAKNGRQRPRFANGPNSAPRSGVPRWGIPRCVGL